MIFQTSLFILWIYNNKPARFLCFLVMKSNSVLYFITACERGRPVITSLRGDEGDIVPLLMLTVQLCCRRDKPSVWGDPEQSLWI